MIFSHILIGLTIGLILGALAEYLLNSRLSRPKDTTVITMPVHREPTVILNGEPVVLTGRWYVDGGDELHVECIIEKYTNYGRHTYPAFRKAGEVHEIYHCHRAS